MTSKYAYQALRTPRLPREHLDRTFSASEIRLLELLPGYEGDDICFNLTHHHLRGGLDYEALSYTWGRPDRVNLVYCESDSLYVTKIMKEALTMLRYPTKKRILWIDQLCINQDDIIERNSQVRIMHLIYRHAKRTVVFLDSGDDPRLDFKLGVWNLYSELRKAKQSGEGNLIKEYRKLLNHPWFQRVWVLQEIGMSSKRNIVVYYRGCELEWRYLIDAATAMDSYEPDRSYDLVQVPPSVRSHKMIISKWTLIADADVGRFASINRYLTMNTELKYINKLSSRTSLWREPRLTEILQDSRFCLATNPSDKIFSLLNMLPVVPAESDLAWLLTVDHSLPVAEVYMRAARYCIEKEFSLEVLGYKASFSNTDGLPTWVPDWTSQRLFPIQRISNPIHYRSQFHRSATRKRVSLARRSDNNKLPVATFSNDGRLMTVIGYRLDTVQQIGSTWEAALDVSDERSFEEWTNVFTGGNPAELTSLPFKPETWPHGIRTTPLSICDFWLRIGRHARLMTSDSLTPFRSSHILQEEWKHSAYYRKRRGRFIILSRHGITAFMLFKDWLALMLPYASVGRKIAASRDGYFLLVPPETQVDDEIFILEGGGSIAHVLRKETNGAHHQYVGAAYVHGFFGVRMPFESWKLERVTLC